ncbi:ankyrin repeat domain-containing protein [Lachnoanaerobaculum saburreum]|uniref:Ankyrin repeat protein n=1 Tax=Lachnoanaerobaculum saburreum TaxID=467210 RepID=A0A133ZDN1_9FIRM|nr:ankyrin repeat domain-containing protein [Lachnoanaerobaculum saburreum]KXB53541.1 ankyrin repeat protein [Lachnoanaerobaculum saburreum]
MTEKKKEIPFLCLRMKELREEYKCSLDDMVKKIQKYEGTLLKKSSLSRAENGKTSEKTLKEYAIRYCNAFCMQDKQIEQFLRGEKTVVVDTSAILKNIQLIDELNDEYDKVIIPKVVVNELNRIKDSKSSLCKKAWEVLRGISYGDKIVSMEYTGKNKNIKNDEKIIFIANEASKKYHTKVDIITDDIDYSVYLKNNENIAALHLGKYIATKQPIRDTGRLDNIKDFFADTYESLERIGKDEVNAYMSDGNTLIISTVRATSKPMNQRKEKIRWLISLGGDVNKRDNARRYFPPLSHAIQVKDYEMFGFLLVECRANPNVGSKNPYSGEKLRQKNEGNMPLMIAAWHGMTGFVKLLCEDERTSLNQQDANGFSALMKACMNGYFRGDKDIRKVLLEAGADTKLVDMSGRSYIDWMNEYRKNGPMLKDYGKSKSYNANRQSMYFNK